MEWQGGGCRFITLLWLSSSIIVMVVVWCRELCVSLTNCRSIIVGMRWNACEIISNTARSRIVHDYMMVEMEWQGGGRRFITLLWLSSSIVVVTVLYPLLTIGPLLLIWSEVLVKSCLIQREAGLFMVAIEWSSKLWGIVSSVAYCVSSLTTFGTAHVGGLYSSSLNNL